MKILGICGSLRRNAFSGAVLDSALSLLPDGVMATRTDIGALPHYNADVENNPAVEAFKAEIAAADGVFIVTPEYNYSIPGVLKNALDWASRPGYNSVFRHKPVLVISISAGATGGVRGQAHLKNVLGALLADVFRWPEIAVAQAESKIAGGKISDQATIGFLDEAITQFLASLSHPQG